MPTALDYETFSAADIRKGGAFVYTEHPSTEVLCLGVKLDNEPTRLWHPGICSNIQDFEPEIHYRAKHGDTFTAWNAGFELLVTNTHAGQRIGMPKLSVQHMRDSAARAASLALPRAMGNCAKALKLPVQKDEEGRRVMLKLSQPRKPTKWDLSTRYTPTSAPEDFAKLYTYCENDVDTEYGIAAFLGQLDASEQEIWELDFIINARGIPVDVPLVQHLIRLRNEYLARLSAECKALCGFEPGQVAMLLGWINDHMGMYFPLADEYGRVKIQKLPALDKANLADALLLLEEGKAICAPVVPLLGSAGHPLLGNGEQTHLAGPFGVVYRVLQIRQQASQTSAKKLDAMMAARNSDGRVRGAHLYWGAGPGRWAGRLVQFQNLKKSMIGNGFSKKWRDAEPEHKHYNLPGAVAGVGTALSLKGFESLFAKPMDGFSSLIRSCIKAPPGFEFAVEDFASIEARVISWLSGEQWRLDVFNTHGKIYEATASQISGIPFDEIGKDSKERQSGKVAELALGFQGGVRALIKMGAIDRYGLKLEDLKPLVKAWRKANPAIVKMWADVEQAVLQAIHYNVVVEVCKCRIYVGGPNKDFLLIELPSGRCIAYAYPRLREVERVWNDEAERFENFDAKRHPRYPHKRVMRDEEGNGIEYIHEGFTPQKVTQFVFEGENTVTRQWEAQTSYGGKETENIVQGTAACLLRNGLLKTERAGFPNIFHVHDEGAGLVRIGQRPAIPYGEAFCDLPLWAVGLPVKSEGYFATRYRKD